MTQRQPHTKGETMTSEEKKRALVKADRKLTKAEWDFVLWGDKPKKEKKYGRSYNRPAMR